MQKHRHLRLQWTVGLNEVIEFRSVSICRPELERRHFSNAALIDRFIDGVIPTEEVAKDFYSLVSKLARLMAEKEPFAFVCIRNPTPRITKPPRPPRGIPAQGETAKDATAK